VGSDNRSNIDKQAMCPRLETLAKGYSRRTAVVPEKDAKATLGPEGQQIQYLPIFNN
jgi:hypothetical protein